MVNELLVPVSGRVGIEKPKRLAVEVKLLRGTRAFELPDVGEIILTESNRSLVSMPI